MALTKCLVLSSLFGCISVCFSDIVPEDIDFPLLTINDGTIRGIRTKTLSEGNTYYSFRGIPYAKPPIGELRWKPPIEASKWNGILDATEDGSQCTQTMRGVVVGEEDCLTINVYTPTLEQNKLPVMVWVHDGGFFVGNSSYSYRAPDLILDENVIFVSFNYRLGVFGFLSTGDVAASGNFALKDQVLALKWIQKNINHFGGDPEAVTVFGQSAGSVSISYLLQSDLSRGLFRGAIFNSGFSTCLWSLDRRAKLSSLLLGVNLHVDTSESLKMVEQMRQFDHVKIEIAATAARSNFLLDILAGLTFGPVKEPVHDGAVFYNNSEENLRNGNFHKVPILMGTTSNEGISVGSLTSLLKLLPLQYDIDHKLFSPVDLTGNDADKTAAANEIYSHFFNPFPATSNPGNVSKFITRDQFHRPIRRAALDMKNYVPVYFYVFSFVGALGRNQGYQEEVNYDGAQILPIQGDGVGHVEDLGYIFHTSSVQDITANEILVQKRTVRLWTNFVKHLNPTPTADPLLQNITWPVNKGTDDNLKYLNIDLNMTIDQNPFAEDMKFYDYIYQKYGRPPYDTY